MRSPITHDLGVIANVADRVTVMYAGRLMEYADKRTLYHEPHHPYTEGLTGSLPERGTRGELLRPVRGQPPSLCAATGCLPPSLRLDAAATAPGREPPLDGSSRRRRPPVCVLAPAGCHRHERQQRRQAPRGSRIRNATPPGRPAAGCGPGRAGGAMTTTSAVPGRRGSWPQDGAGADRGRRRVPSPGPTALFGRGRETVHAVDGVSLQGAARGDGRAGGESGCGKSTLARS